MKFWQPTALAQAAVLALGAGFAGAAAAQSTADLLKELQELKKRVAELEAKQKAPEAKRGRRPVGHDARAGGRVQPHLGEDRGDGRRARRLGLQAA